MQLPKSFVTATAYAPAAPNRCADDFAVDAGVIQQLEKSKHKINNGLRPLNYVNPKDKKITSKEIWPHQCSIVLHYIALIVYIKNKSASRFE